MPFAVPSSPTPDITALVGGAVRAVLALLAGMGLISAGSPLLVDSTVQLIASALVAVGTLAWSLWVKVQAARRLHASVVQSAATGIPSKVIR
jgi:hypothetical protein